MSIQPLYLGQPVNEAQLSVLFAKWADPVNDLPTESFRALYRNAQNDDAFVSMMARETLHTLSNGTLNIVEVSA